MKMTLKGFCFNHSYYKSNTSTLEYKCKVLFVMYIFTVICFTNLLNV